MIPAEQADGVDYLINLPQAVAVHSLIQFIKVLADRFVIHAIQLGITFIDHFQNRFRIVDIIVLTTGRRIPSEKYLSTGNM